MTKDKFSDFTSRVELFTLDALPNILWVAHRTDNFYQAYVGEKILDNVKTNTEKLFKLREEYNFQFLTDRNGCCVIASIELERPTTGIPTEQFLMQVSEKFVTFRKTLPKALGGVRTTILTGAEIYEVITHFPKETMIPF